MMKSEVSGEKFFLAEGLAALKQGAQEWFAVYLGHVMLQTYFLPKCD